MKRREFIGSALATASIAAVPGILSAATDPFNGQPVRTGHIGVGSQGRHHLNNMLKLPGFEIRTLCDVLPFQLDAAKELVGQETGSVTDYRRLLDDPDIDAVVIATPFHFHARPMIDALDAGKHVYCEKTLVKGFDQIGQTAAALAGSDRVAQAGYQHRYSVHLREIARLVRSGHIGEISKVECQWNRQTDWRRHVPSPEYERAVNWRMYREYSGGLAAELSSHKMDILEWVMDTRPRQVLGTGGIDFWKDGRETRDNISLLVRYENGVTASFTCLTTNKSGGFRMTFLGTEGTIVTTLDEAWVSLKDPDAEMMDGVDAMSGATMALGHGKGYHLKPPAFSATSDAMAAFRASILGKREPDASAEKALVTARTVQLSLDAMDNGTVETF